MVGTLIKTNFITNKVKITFSYRASWGTIDDSVKLF